MDRLQQTLCARGFSCAVSGVGHVSIALMRDDVKTFSGYMKARLGGESFA